MKNRVIFFLAIFPLLLTSCGMRKDLKKEFEFSNRLTSDVLNYSKDGDVYILRRQIGNSMTTALVLSNNDTIINGDKFIKEAFCSGYVRAHEVYDVGVLEYYLKEKSIMPDSIVGYRCSDCDSYLIQKVRILKQKRKDILITTLFDGNIPPSVRRFISERK